MGNIYTAMKIFHFKDKVDSLPKDAESILPLAYPYQAD